MHRGPMCKGSGTHRVNVMFQGRQKDEGESGSYQLGERRLVTPHPRSTGPKQGETGGRSLESRPAGMEPAGAIQGLKLERAKAHLWRIPSRLLLSVLFPSPLALSLSPQPGLLEGSTETAGPTANYTATKGSRTRRVGSKSVFSRHLLLPQEASG